MTYTGGTTGRPKGVLATHRARAVTAHTVMVEEAIDERDMVGVVTPMFHVAALNIMFQPAILAGATVTMLSPWSADGFPRHGAAHADDGEFHGADPGDPGGAGSEIRSARLSQLDSNAASPARRCPIGRSAR